MSLVDRRSIPWSIVENLDRWIEKSVWNFFKKESEKRDTLQRVEIVAAFIGRKKKVYKKRRVVDLSRVKKYMNKENGPEHFFNQGTGKNKCNFIIFKQFYSNKQ